MIRCLTGTRPRRRAPRHRTDPGVVRYTAGPNQFGGTMQILLVGRW